ncbi:MAG TPA: ShlB/FhaC/HecB family hemolysin secretion/activation protein [Allosphingosinicella sp.]|nr:ShlB/FhaC/HecB family hemolysin secretion/activation protein [Allosphingosinicella sp.]
MTSRPTLRRWWKRTALAAAALLAPWAAPAAEAQHPDDRSDAAIASGEEREAEGPRPAGPSAPSVGRTRRAVSRAAFPPFVAGAIRVEGATALAPQAFAAAIEPYLGRQLSPADLRSLAGDVADAARAAGFGLATAWVPPQSVTNGVLRVRVDEGRIEAVEASGPAAAAVERLLAGLTGEAPVRTAALERQLLLAGDLAGVTVGRARLVRSDGRNILRVDTSRDRVQGRASIDNWGTSAIGPVRARLSVDIAGILDFGDRLTVGGVVTPLQPREFQLVQAAYSVPVGRRGTMATIRGHVSHSAAGAALRGRDLDGDSVEIEAGLSHPLVRSRARSLWGHVFFGLRDSDLNRAGVPLREDRIASLSAGLYGSTRGGGGDSRGRLTLTQGFDLLGATEAGDPLASRPDAGGAFTKLAFWGEHVRRLGGGVSVRFGAEGQIATRPLLASEEMGLGGREFGRGFDYREFSGDHGLAGSGELRFDLPSVPRPLRSLQLYAYGDAGRAWNRDGGSGGGSLASAGGGLRVALRNRLEAGIELGVPLTDGALDLRPDPRFSFTASSRF